MSRSEPLSAAALRATAVELSAPQMKANALAKRPMADRSIAVSSILFILASDVGLIISFDPQKTPEHCTSSHLLVARVAHAAGFSTETGSEAGMVLLRAWSNVFPGACIRARRDRLEGVCVSTWQQYDLSYLMLAPSSRPQSWMTGRQSTGKQTYAGHGEINTKILGRHQCVLKGSLGMSLGFANKEYLHHWVHWKKYDNLCCN
jgi:hypothetical protein